MKIHIVETDRVIAAKLSSILSESGYTDITIITSGQKAMEAPGIDTLEEQTVFFIDVRDKMAFPLACKLRSRPGAEIIFMAESLSGSDITETQKYRPHGYISLPPGPEAFELVSTLKGVTPAETDMSLKEEHHLFLRNSKGVINGEILFDESGSISDIRIITVNKSFVEMTGIPKEIAEGALLTVLYSKLHSTFPDWKKLLLKMLSGTPVRFQKTEGAVQHHYKLSGYSLNGSELVVIIENISRLIKYKEKIRQQNRFFNTLLDSISSPFCYKDLDGYYRFCNKQYARTIVGVSKKELIGKRLSDFSAYLGEKATHEIEAHEKGLVNEGARDIVTTRITCADGKQRDYKIFKGAVRDNEGEARGLVVSMNDISRHILLEENLRRKQRQIQRSDRYIKSLLAAIDAILIGVNSKDEIQIWNRKCVSIFNLSPGAVLGKKITALEIPLPWTKIYEGISSSITSQKPVNLSDISIYGYILSINITPMFKGNEVRGFLIYGRDITHTRKIENELNQTSRIQSIGLLASGIAHEINTPAQFINDNLLFIQDAWKTITGVLEKSDQTELCEDCKYFLEEIPAALSQSLDGMERISKIVKSMKSFAHPGSEEKREHDMHKTIEDTINITRNEWKYTTTIIRKFTEKSAMATCYPGLMNQAILNMIINAVHAIEDAIKMKLIVKGVITIQTKRKEKSFIITIHDNGTGMREEVMEQIFTPFFTTKEVGRGTGQGLSLAYNIITEQHKGAIRVKSKLNKGSTFVIEIPV